MLVGYGDFRNFKNEGFQIEKTISYENVCYHIKHPQITRGRNRERGVIYNIWLFHHTRSEFNLFLSSDNNFPDGESIDSVKIIGETKAVIFVN